MIAEFIWLEQATFTINSVGGVLGIATTLIVLLTFIGGWFKKPWATDITAAEERFEKKMTGNDEKLETRIAENTRKHAEVDKRLDRLEFNHTVVIKEIDEVRALIKEEAALGRIQLDKIDSRMEIIRQLIDRRGKDQ